jgi:replicative DNA helicase
VTTPADLAAERAVLGSVLLDETQLDSVARRVKPEDFADPRNRRIFAAIGKVADSGAAVDLVTVNAELGGSGDVAYLASLIDGIPDTKNAGHYAEIVKEKSNLREIVAACEAATSAIATGKADFGSVSRGLADRVFALSDAGGEFDLAFRSEIAYSDLLIDRLDRIAGGEVFSIKTGIPEIDELLDGYEPGTLNLICGETSNGKTDLSLEMLRRMAEAGFSCGYISIDMPAFQLQVRKVRPLAGLQFHDVKRAASDPAALMRVTEALDHLRKLPIYTMDASHITIAEIERAVRSFRRAHGLDVLFLDYIQLVDAKGQTREREVSMISRGLKRVARSEKIPVVALAQLSRTSGDDHRPALHRLRDSGQLEQDAATVIGVYKPDKPENKDDQPDVDTIEISVLKQQNGACKSERLPMDWRIGRLGGPRAPVGGGSTGVDLGHSESRAAYSTPSGEFEFR